MSTVRALRFLGVSLGADAAAGSGGDGEASAGGAGTGLATGSSGALALVEGEAAVRQALVLLLSTAPGERLMRPEYGSHLHRLVFAPNDETTAGLAIHYVRSALARWEPRVEVLDVDAGADPQDPERLLITLRYRIRATLTDQILDLSVAVGGP